MKYKIGIIYNKTKPSAKELADKISLRLKERGNKFFVCNSADAKPQKCDFVLSIGGDGTMLKSIRTFAPLNIAVKGINLGSLGFLTDTDANQTFHLLENIFEKGVKCEERSLLSGEFKCGGKRINLIAANDFVIRSANTGSLITVNMSVNKTAAAEYKCDGMIAATPMGSTAYSLSAYGPIVYPALSLLLFTPISPHTLTQRPMILSGKDDIILSANNKGKGGKILISVDGQENYLVPNNSEIKFSLYKKPAKLIKNCGKPYFETLKEKLHWGT